MPSERFVFYSNPPAWKKFGNQIKVAHFVGFGKPWIYRLAADDDAICQAIEHLDNPDADFITTEQADILTLWWALFFKRVKHQLSYGMVRA